MATGSASHYFDLNILHDPKDPATTLEKVRIAIKLGYDCVAINVDVGDMDAFATSEGEASNEPGSGSGKRKKKQQKKQIPEPYIVPCNKLDCSALAARGKTFRQYSRLTMTIGESLVLFNQFKGHDIVAKYDIVAVIPKNEQILQSLATKLEPEVISFVASEPCPWLRKANLIQAAIARGISFELCYSPALSDSSVRRQVLCNARELYRSTRGRNIILSSRAEMAIEQRSPLDAANLVVLFGRTPEEGKRAVGVNSNRVVLFSATRHTIKGVMHVRTLDAAPPRLLEQLLKIPEFSHEAISAISSGSGLQAKKPITGASGVLVAEPLTGEGDAAMIVSETSKCLRTLPKAKRLKTSN